MSYFFHPAAETEHLEAVAFYESRRVGLGAAYLAAFEGSMKRVAEGPHRYPLERNPNIRRIGLERFPYHVVYRETATTVQVLAVPIIADVQHIGSTGFNKREHLPTCPVLQQSLSPSSSCSPNQIRLRWA